MTIYIFVQFTDVRLVPWYLTCESPFEVININILRIEFSFNYASLLRRRFVVELIKDTEGYSFLIYASNSGELTTTSGDKS